MATFFLLFSRVDQIAGIFLATDLKPPTATLSSGFPSICIGPSAMPWVFGNVPVRRVAKLTGV